MHVYPYKINYKFYQDVYFSISYTYLCPYKIGIIYVIISIHKYANKLAYVKSFPHDLMNYLNNIFIVKRHLYQNRRYIRIENIYINKHIICVN